MNEKKEYIHVEKCIKNIDTHLIIETIPKIFSPQLPICTASEYNKCKISLLGPNWPPGVNHLKVISGV